MALCRLDLGAMLGKAAGRVDTHFRLLKEAKHALRRRTAPLQVLHGLRELGERLREQADVHHERHDDAELDAPVHRERRADHAYGHVAEVADEGHERHHEAR